MERIKHSAVNAYRWIIKERILQIIVFSISFPILAAGAALHFSRVMTGQTTSQFESAIVSATLGGLLMVVGSVDKNRGEQAKRLLNIGKWFLVASVFSTIFGLFVPWLASIGGLDNIDSRGSWIIFAVIVVSLSIGMFAFARAMSFLLVQLPKIGKDRDCSIDQSKLN